MNELMNTNIDLALAEEIQFGRYIELLIYVMHGAKG